MKIFYVNGSFNLAALLISIFIGEGMAFLSKTLSTGSQNEYKSFKQPDWAPPGMTFPIVWTIIFFINAISGYRIYMLLGNKAAGMALAIYAVLLLFNCSFTVMLFRYEKMKLALKQLLLMWVLILIAIILFYRVDKISAYLFLPYFIWVTFAAALFYNVNRLNQE